MKREHIIISVVFSSFVSSLSVNAQATGDSIYRKIDLTEITIKTQNRTPRPQTKSVASIEEHLQTARQVDMIKRGSYAWEPTVNNMSSERVSTTIDGMKIFCACTDKMDPVTSYVETGNLGEIEINNGVASNENTSNQIGGSIDLKLKKAGFDGDSAIHANIKASHEWNGHLNVYGIDGYISRRNFYVNLGTFYRHADNYTAGGGKEIKYSQYTKNNAFVNTGIRWADYQTLEASLIYDLARNVGYPALTMDVKKAEGIITSLTYSHRAFTDFFSRWQTKLYYNHVTHIMDDTKRKEIVMHMDMPGETETFGLNSYLRGHQNEHTYNITYSIYRNRSVADMTMYPNDKSNPPMYMLTWPDVRHVNTGISVSEEWKIKPGKTLKLSGNIHLQHNNVHSDEGYKTLKIYAPSMNREENRAGGNVAAKYELKNGGWLVVTGLGLASRMPTISEQYGYFLFNTLDSYDYLGNPTIENEKTLETELSASWQGEHTEVIVEGNIFLFNNYIAGRIKDNIYRMTIGAKGVKQYENISKAMIANVSIELNNRIGTFVKWKNNVKWAIGKDDNNDYLPLITPIAGISTLAYDYGRLNVNGGIEWAAAQKNYGKKYGETKSNGYLVTNASVGYRWRIASKIFLSIKAGVENITDKKYTTYSDWNDIARKGRNGYLNINIGF